MTPRPVLGDEFEQHVKVCNVCILFLEGHGRPCAEGQHLAEVSIQATRPKFMRRDSADLEAVG